MRRCSDLIEEFMRSTESTGSPEPLRRWTIIFMIAAAMERRTWLTTRMGALYPNLFIFLVAPPGIGKTAILRHAYSSLTELGADDNHLHVAPTNMSSAALADALDEAKRKLPILSHPLPEFNSLSCIVPELQTLFPMYDPLMMATLTDLYDNGHYSEKKRGNKLKIEIPNAQVSILGACTPSALHTLIPAAAWDQGFMSRVILAYSGETVQQPMFANIRPSILTSDFRADLESVFALIGQFSVSQQFKDAFHTWEEAGYEPVPTHTKLQNYNIRRKAMVLKLSMVASAAQSSTLILTEDHFEDALAWLCDAEAYMPEIFKASGLGGDSSIMEECFRFAFDHYLKNKKTPVPQSILIKFLSQRVSTHLIFQMLDVMVKSKMFEKTIEPTPAYIPLPDAYHLQ